MFDLSSLLAWMIPAAIEVIILIISYLFIFSESLSKIDGRLKAIEDNPFMKAVRQIEEKVWVEILTNSIIREFSKGKGNPVRDEKERIVELAAKFKVKAITVDEAKEFEGLLERMSKLEDISHLLLIGFVKSFLSSVGEAAVRKTRGEIVLSSLRKILRI